MKILLLETIHDDALRILQTVGQVQLVEFLTAEAVLAEWAAAAAVLTRGRGRIPEQALVAGKELRCVARCGAGTDNIDVGTATRMGIPVLYNPHSASSTVAEHAILLALAVGRRLSYLDRQVKENNWAIRETVSLGTELRGKTLGILGLGRIGTRVAELGHAFGMEVLYWSPRHKDTRFLYVDRDEIFRRSDFLSIHVPLTPETRNMVDGSVFDQMKPTAILINTSRGEVVDEKALVAALERGALAGAGLDVLSSESPTQDHPLWKFSNVVVTPHVAGLTDRAYRRTCTEVAEQVARVLSGNWPDAHFVRNPEVLRRSL